MQSRAEARIVGLPVNDDLRSVAAWQEGQRDQQSVVTVPISSLLPSDSPRLAGENIEHIRMMAESDATFPPIIVNRSTMRVIDGMHRLRAASLRGQREVDVRLFDGDQERSFVLAVTANVAHGLRLSLADRVAAAARIIRSHPDWSDHMIASTTGLAAKTVGAVRRRSTEDNPQLNVRIGRDGRVRPLNAAEGRRIAGELMAKDPSAPLREIASAAGISLGTASDVRERVRRGDSPVLPDPRDDGKRKDEPKSDNLPRRRSANIEQVLARDQALILSNLKRDPSLRFTKAGRLLLQLMHVLSINKKEREGLIDNLPAHCTNMVCDAARACAGTWHEFADQLERRRV